MNKTIYRQWIVVCIVLFSFARQANSEEIDQLTNREKIASELSDTSNIINQWTERQFTKILSNSQNKGGGCDREALIESLRLGFDTRLTPIYISLSKDAKVPKAYIPKNQSIYQDYGVTEVANTSPALRVANTVVGLDKIDHFFGHGFGYWRYYEHQKREQDALDLGENQEKGTLGLGVAGVKSYADLSANYAGLQFWRELLDGPNPYIVCKGKKWARSGRTFKIQEYSSAAWDEGINCNSYASADHLNKVLAALNTKTHPCPVNLDICKQLAVKYAQVPSLLHPRCRQGNHTSSLIEVPLEKGARVLLKLAFDVVNNEGVVAGLRRLRSTPNMGAKQRGVK